MKLAIIAVVFGAHGASAQDARQDSARSLAPVVVVAERSATPINRSTAAVTRITGEEIAKLPHATVADVLRQVPGFAVVDFDGLGRDPQVMARGFYGGGEAEYVVVLVDGRPANRTHNGTVAWDALPPLSTIESIEIVRGSASAAHGDAAVGGVINIVTRSSTTSASRWTLAGGSHGTGTGAADLTGFFAGVPGSLSIGLDRTGGFREHAQRSSSQVRGMLEFPDAWRMIAHTTRRDFDEPGALIADLADADRSQSDPLFRFDNTRDEEIGLALEHQRQSSEGRRRSMSLSLARRAVNAVRTIVLAPGFGDTMARQLDTRRGTFDLQVDAPGAAASPLERVTFGGSVAFEDLTSHYYQVAPDAEPAGDAGNGARGVASLFVHASVAPKAWLRWTAGARADWLFDGFHRDGTVDLSASHAAISPKVGLNLRYAGGGRSAGHLFLAASRSFKAPTLDQLYDQRTIPVPFPPFAIGSSNPDLEPQRGTSLEAGVYHDIVGASSHLNATVAVYQIAMKDEIDFDLQTFSYMNIARSRHRGVEASLNVSSHSASAFLSLGLQDVVARAGDNAGRRLKAIPTQTLSAGVTVTPHHGGTVTLSMTRMADMYLDDANTRRLDNWTRVDAQVSHSLGDIELVFGARNLLDATYNSTGYLDPSGSGLAYYYPAAGRVVTLGIRHGW